MITTIPAPALPKTFDGLHIVGGPVCVLEQDYSVNQHWLPLGTTFAFNAEPAPERPVPYTPHNFKSTPVFLQIEDRHRLMYPRDHANHPKQYVLPFIEHKRVNNGAMKALAKHGFPLWDRAPMSDEPKKGTKAEDVLFQIEIAGHYRLNIEKWCNENLRGRYYIRGERLVIFELEFDAMMAKMYFS